MRKIQLILFSIILSISLMMPHMASADNSTAPANDTNFFNRSDYQEHMLFSYAVQFTTYELLTQKLEVDPTAAMIYSIVGTLALGLARDKFLFNKPNLGSYMEANLVGVSAASLTITVFQF
jgi:hypothetical protein